MRVIVGAAQREKVKGGSEIVREDISA